MAPVRPPEAWSHRQRMPRRALAQKAIAHVRRDFSKDNMCAKTLDVYNEVLALTHAER